MDRTFSESLDLSEFGDTRFPTSEGRPKSVADCVGRRAAKIMGSEKGGTLTRWIWRRIRGKRARGDRRRFLPTGANNKRRQCHVEFSSPGVEGVAQESDVSRQA